MKSGKGITVLLTVLVLTVAVATWAAADKAGKKENGKTASGTVVSHTATSLVVSHGAKGKMTETSFVLTPETKMEGALKDGAHVEVHYRIENSQNVATKVEAPAAPTASSSTKSSSKPKY
ncbi:MAG TPA: DUF5666 domain-containing protein [Candidatus Xenobia bacterium]|nr:DUF5666 domain-containing protein [Candidatus Xenobia bacterium]